MLLLYRSQEIHCPGLRRHNLHSTMLLLYRDVVYRQVRRYLIFTFHYASTLSFLVLKGESMSTSFTFHYASTLSCAALDASHQHDIIYIPLCFYFILALSMLKVGNSRFTFHYASTLSTSRGKYDRPFFLFTFHYASTLSS